MPPNLVLYAFQMGLVTAGMWWHGATEHCRTSNSLGSNSGSGDMIFHVHTALVKKLPAAAFVVSGWIVGQLSRTHIGAKD